MGFDFFSTISKIRDVLGIGVYDSGHDIGPSVASLPDIAGGSTAAPANTDFEIPEQTAQWDGIVIHHSATVETPHGHEWEAIRRFHMSYRIGGDIVTAEQYAAAVAAGKPGCEKPWSDIGYDLGIERDDDDGLKVRMGRSWMKAGAHAGFVGNNYFNEHYLGLCVVGSYDGVAPDDETWNLTLATVRQIMSRFGFDKSKVIGHREVYDIVGVPRLKTCPGLRFDMEKFRSML